METVVETFIITFRDDRGIRYTDRFDDRGEANAHYNRIDEDENFYQVNMWVEQVHLKLVRSE